MSDETDGSMQISIEMPGDMTVTDLARNFLADIRGRRIAEPTTDAVYLEAALRMTSTAKAPKLAAGRKFRLGVTAGRDHRRVECERLRTESQRLRTELAGRPPADAFASIERGSEEWHEYDHRSRGDDWEHCRECSHWRENLADVRRTLTQDWPPSAEDGYSLIAAVADRVDPVTLADDRRFRAAVDRVVDARTSEMRDALFRDQMAEIGGLRSERDQALVDLDRLHGLVGDPSLPEWSQRLRTRLLRRAESLQQERDAARRDVARSEVLVEILSAEQPDGEEWHAAERAIMDRWPDLAKDRVHGEQLAETAIGAAWAVNHQQRTVVASPDRPKPEYVWRSPVNGDGPDLHIDVDGLYYVEALGRRYVPGPIPGWERVETEASQIRRLQWENARLQAGDELRAARVEVATLKGENGRLSAEIRTLLDPPGGASATVVNLDRYAPTMPACATVETPSGKLVWDPFNADWKSEAAGVLTVFPTEPRPPLEVAAEPPARIVPGHITTFGPTGSPLMRIVGADHGILLELDTAGGQLVARYEPEDLDEAAQVFVDQVVRLVNG